ncbi:hypothetical protein KEM48_012197 [Puccinia striiformis f. sp. tritici PST-130]|nr:hypothetical protein KEM48_012197 [Puccinia striiformis f. sp. tritici PST-130]
MFVNNDRKSFRSSSQSEKHLVLTGHMLMRQTSSLAGRSYGGNRDDDDHAAYLTWIRRDYPGSDSKLDARLEYSNEQEWKRQL